MIQLRRILLPTDFSEHSRAAVDYACGLAERFGSELHLLHVVRDLALEVPEFAMGLSFPTHSEEWPLRLRKLELAALEQLSGVLDPAWQQGRKIVRAVKSGVAYVEIVRYAREHEIDLIIMGTHGRSGLAHILLGSVAERVVRKAPCPVLTVRPAEHRFEMP